VAIRFLLKRCKTTAGVSAAVPDDKTAAEKIACHGNNKPDDQTANPQFNADFDEDIKHLSPKRHAMKIGKYAANRTHLLKKLLSLDRFESRRASPEIDDRPADKIARYVHYAKGKGIAHPCACQTGKFIRPKKSAQGKYQNHVNTQRRRPCDKKPDCDTHRDLVRGIGYVQYAQLDKDIELSPYSFGTSWSVHSRFSQ
jgi:hypothetical protein